MLIGVVGLHGSGKDTIALYMVESYGFVHKDLGQEIRNQLKALGKDFRDRNLMIATGNEMRQKYGFDYWCKNAIESSKAEDIVITSVRNPSEADFIKSHRGSIVEVSAAQDARFARTVQRVKDNPSLHGDTTSLEGFVAQEKKELDSVDPSKQQLIKCISMADYRLNNNGSVEQLKKQIDDFILKLRVVK